MMTLMGNTSRPLIALLVGTVAFFALWVVALKPGSSSSNGAPPTQGLSAYQAAIKKAHQAVQISAADNARAGGGGASSPTPSSAAPTPSTVAATRSTAAATPSTKTRSTATTATHPRATHKPATHTTGAVGRLSVVQRALRAHKALALLFYNPSAADDQAVKQELAAVPNHHGKVVKLTIPLTELPNYTAVTDQVPVNFSPTLVVIAPSGKAAELVGFSDQFEIAQRVDDALAAK
jgi:hypothetical protein